MRTKNTDLFHLLAVLGLSSCSDNAEGVGSDSEGDSDATHGGACAAYASKGNKCSGGVWTNEQVRAAERICNDEIALQETYYGEACAMEMEDHFACLSNLSCADFKDGSGCDVDWTCGVEPETPVSSVELVLDSGETMSMGMGRGTGFFSECTVGGCVSGKVPVVTLDNPTDAPGIGFLHIDFHGPHADPREWSYPVAIPAATLQPIPGQTGALWSLSWGLYGDCIDQSTGSLIITGLDFDRRVFTGSLSQIGLGTGCNVFDHHGRLSGEFEMPISE